MNKKVKKALIIMGTGAFISGVIFGAGMSYVLTH